MLTASVRLPKDPGAKGLIEMAKPELDGLLSSQRYLDMRKVRDQWKGGANALQGRYHPEMKGLSRAQQEKVLRYRHHVNLVRSAVDRFVNSIHSGKIVRKCGDAEIAGLLATNRHKKAMAKLCEDAFLYGMGYLVPSLRMTAGGRLVVSYWNPDPLYTVLVTRPGYPDEVMGLVELLLDWGPGVLVPQSVGHPWRAVGYRWVSRFHSGRVVWSHTGNDQVEEVTVGDCGFVPATVAKGREEPECKYADSLVLEAADGSIAATRNQVNLELLRDLLTQVLLVVSGAEPEGDSSKDSMALLKMLTSESKDLKAEFVQPASQLEQVIKLGEQVRINVAVSAGLPLDTMLPERVTGADASATAAIQRAFPLTQRMQRMGADWEDTEVAVSSVIAGLVEYSRTKAPVDLDDLGARLGVACSVMPSVAEREAETLSNWQQQTEKFYRPVSEAIEYYSPHLSPEEKARLEKLWEEKLSPDGADEKEEIKFAREVIKVLAADGTVADVAANLTNLRELWNKASLPLNPGYEEPWLPVADEKGVPVTGDVVKDPQGDIVGGVVGMPKEAAKDAEIFQYHIEQGVVTKNEVRAKLGLPPIDGGDVPAGEAAAGGPDGQNGPDGRNGQAGLLGKIWDWIRGKGRDEGGGMRDEEKSAGKMTGDGGGSEGGKV